MKKWKLVASLLMGLVLVTGCGNDTSEDTESSSEQTSKTERTTERSTEESTEESNTGKQSEESGDWEAIEKVLKTETEAEKINLLYENKEPIVSENEDAKVTIEGYRYYQIENFSRNFDIPFGDQHEKGGVIIMDALIQNKMDQKVYVGPGFSLNLTGYNAAIMRKKELLAEDLVSDLIKKDNEVVEKAQIRGFVALSMKPEAMEKIVEHGEAMLEIPGIYTKKDSFKSADAVLAKKKRQSLSMLRVKRKSKMLVLSIKTKQL